MDMKKTFKYCWVSHDKVYVEDEEGRKFTIDMTDLLKILKNADLKANLQRKNYKLEAND